jgi:VTC domain
MTFEYKFLVDDTRADQVIAWTRRHLLRDPHGSGLHTDEYTTATVYWDTPDFDVLERRGSHGRAKYRIRRYGAADTVFLERKLRRSSRVSKRRSPVALDDLGHLDLRREPARPWEGDWFRRRLHLRRLQPTCLLHYDRIARYVGAYQGPRLTIDRNLRAVTSTTLCFGADAMQPVLSGRCIVELKYEDAMPAAFKAVLEQLSIAPSSISKYRHAMSALGRSAVVGASVRGVSDV